MVRCLLLVHQWDDDDKFIASLDLGFSINIMAATVVNKLNMGKLRIKRTMEITIADQSVIISLGMVEDVLVKIKDLVFPIDFVILDIEVDNKKR